MTNPHGKVLIWDLGNTLLQADTWCFAKKIGLIDFILYPLLDWKNPKKIHELAMDVLVCVEAPSHDAHSLATAQGKLMPPVMCHWLSGTANMQDLKKSIETCINSWASAGKFSSRRQQRLAANTLKLVFDTEKFIQCMKPIPAGIALLKDCASDKHLKQYVLSNWDPYSYEFLINAPHIVSVLNYFEQDSITISGHLGVIKPQAAIYTQFMEMHQLTPGQCILIDDQVENIEAAQKLGITGILLEKANYKAVKARLIEMGIIS